MTASALKQLTIESIAFVDHLDKTDDTIVMSDAANRAGTDTNQWYVTISLTRNKVAIFTPDKSAFRTQVQAGGRELALDLKLENST